MQTTTSQPNQGFPRYDTPFVDLQTGYLARPWMRFLLALWQKFGGAVSSLPGTYYLNVTSTGQIGVWDSLTNTLVGFISPVTPEPPQPLTPSGASPYTFMATVPGTLFVDGGNVSISRDGSAYYPIGLVGGGIPLLAEDSVQIAWFSTTPPPITWFPSAV